MSQNNKRIVYNKTFALLYAANDVNDVTEWATHLRLHLASIITLPFPYPFPQPFP